MLDSKLIWKHVYEEIDRHKKNGFKLRGIAMYLSDEIWETPTIFLDFGIGLLEKVIWW